MKERHAGHSHSHAHPADRKTLLNAAFFFGAFLNTIFIGAEVFYGFVSNSTALLGDAGHNFGDVLGILLAWLGTVLGSKTPTRRFTYGLGSTSILAALFNGLVLILTSSGIVVEAVRRLYQPQPVAGGTVIVVAAMGIFINGISAIAFRRESHSDINVRAAFLHLLGDAVVSAAVVISGVLVAITHMNWIDPGISLLVAGFLVVSTWKLLTQSVSLALNAVPQEIDPQRVRSYLIQLNGVTEIHDLHIWPTSTTEIALTSHLVMGNGYPGNDFLTDIATHLRQNFGIEHSTIQIEIAGNSGTCASVCNEHHG